MDLNLSPYIRRAWYNTLLPGEVIGPRVIFDYELVLIKEGHAHITVEDRHYFAGPGDMFIFRPRQRHAIEVVSSEHLIQPHIHFDLTYYENRARVPISYHDLDRISADLLPYFREDVLDRFISPFPSFLHPSNELFIEQLLFNIIHAVENPRPFNDVYLQRTFLELWEHVLLDILYASKQTSKQENTAALIKQFIDHNDSRPLSLREIAQATHFSKNYISSIFQEKYGVSPIRYHVSSQVQKAKQMILLTNMSLGEIAESVGFESLQNFSRVFKKIDGQAPSAYRKKKAAPSEGDGEPPQRAR